jgi:YD repeat-containing protein
MRGIARSLALIVVVIGLASNALAQGGVQYVYDDLGRLVGVIDGNGDSATYRYDAVGNLLAIERHSASVVSIISFSPGHGAIGATVTIAGTGFSPTPGLNTVTFNGTSAAVSSATANQLVVTVPSGATTGTISVTAPAGSATSADPFAIAAAGTPTITSFSPTTGLAGTSVTITGTGFDTTAANDKTRFNNGLAGAGSTTSTTIAALVPQKTASGRISVATPLGTAVSTADFIIPPSPYGVSDVATSGRIPFATPTSVTVATATKIALMLFDGTVGQRVSLLATNGIFGQVFGCDLNVTLLDPTGAVVVPLSCIEGNAFVDTATLHVAGTYTLLVDPANNVTGSTTLKLYDIPADASGTIVPGGSAVTATMSTPGQNGLYTFTATAGQRVSLLGTNGINGQVGLVCDVQVTMRKPDGSALAPMTCMEGTGFTDVATAPATGTYSVFIDPASAATGSLTLTMYDVPADVGGTLASDGTPMTVTMTVPGQNAALTFTGTTGDRISLVGTNGISGQIGLVCDVTTTIRKPDGTSLASACMEGSGFIDTVALPATGTYTVVVDPAGAALGSLTLALHAVPADLTGPITADGTPVTTTISVPGQNAALTFSGTTGQRVFLMGTNGMSGQVSFTCDVDVTIRKPDGSSLATACMEGNGFIDAVTLPATGSYTVFLDPASGATGSLTLSLYTFSDFTGSITAGGSSVVATSTVPGQNGALTFAGTAGQRVSLLGTSGMSGQVWFDCDVYVSILKPDASVLASPACMESSGFLDAVTLPSTGTYTVVFNPNQVAVGSVTLTLYLVPADPTTTLTINGSSSTLTTTTAGQDAQATFSGTASQQVTVHLTGNTMGTVTVRVLKPDGSQLSWTFIWSGSVDIAVPTLPATGTYTIAVSPDGAAVGSITLGVTSP